MNNPVALSSARCFHHEMREAVCRCTGCSRSFCRECVVDHDGRLVCAGCLEARGSSLPAASRLRGLRTVLFATGGFVLTWTFFYLAVRAVLGLTVGSDEWAPR